ncbi:AraC family transcriptional regulator [Chitinophagaceae bacterium 26-R-25]|nr:AraC family transcriptional regulator [Chitinophagaceae bacterium 26-R-25]
MTMLYSDVYGKLPLQPFAHDIDGYIIAGADAFSYKGDAGTILIQQQITEDFTFHYANFLLNDRAIINFRHDGFAMQSMIAMNEDIVTLVQGTGNFLLRKDHLVITHNPSNEMSFVFEKGKNYCAFGSSFNLDFVYKYLQAYFLQEEMPKFSSNNSFSLTEGALPASRKMLDTISDIIHYALPRQLNESYTSIKMQELFVLQLATAFRRPEPKLKLSERQLEALEEIRQLMLQDITTHYSHKELARKAHINLHTLKNGFKQVYGLPPLEYRNEVRLQKAKELLQQTGKPIKEIAMLAGYASFSSFVTAFTNHFGYSPGTVRK